MFGAEERKLRVGLSAAEGYSRIEGYYGQLLARILDSGEEKIDFFGKHERIWKPSQGEIA